MQFEFGVEDGIRIGMVGIIVGAAVTGRLVNEMICGGSEGGMKKVGVDDGVQESRIKTITNNMTYRLKLGVKRDFITPEILLRRSIYPPQ